MSSDNEKSIFELRLKNISSKINNTNSNSLINNPKNNSHGKLMKKENLLDSKLNFKPIFEKINKNKLKYNKALLSNFEQRENDLKNLISVDRLINYIYQSGIPYKINFKKALKHKTLKEKVHHNLEIEKIELGSMDYFNLDDFSKGKISKQILNRKNENHLFHSKNFISKKSGILQNISIFRKNNKKKTKSRLFDFKLKYNRKINNNIKSESNMRKTFSIFNYNAKNIKKQEISFSKLNKGFINSTKSFNYKDLDNKANYSNKTIIKTESKKIINSYKEKNKDSIKNNESVSKNSINKETKSINSLETYHKNISNISIKHKKPKNKLKPLLLDNINDKNYKNFKNSISDLYRYNKNRNNQLNKIGVNDLDFLSKEEKMLLENKKYEKLTKNIIDANNKLKKSIDYFNIIMNKRSHTERNKEGNIKITKMFSSLGKKTINNMATDLGICQNHIKDKLISFIEDSSFKKRKTKELDPTLEIILDRKLKSEQNNNQYEYDDIGDDYDFIKETHIKNYQKKEIERLGELIGKINNKVAFDLSNYLMLYNKNMGNKIEEMKEKKVRKERNDNVKYLKKTIENQIFNLKRIKLRNTFKYNKIIHNFNDFYTKIKNEKDLNEEYRKLLLQVNND